MSMSKVITTWWISSTKFNTPEEYFVVGGRTRADEFSFGSGGLRRVGVLASEGVNYPEITSI